MRKRLLSLLLIPITLTSCKYCQVYHTATDSSYMTRTNDHHVYDDGSVRIIYDFWANEGKMAFTIYNVSKKPIYIDWKRSSFIQDNGKNDYYTDATTSKYESLNLGAYNSRRTANVGITRGMEVKEEQVSFLPPGSFISKTFYSLIPGSLPVSTRAIADTLINGKKTMLARLQKGPETLVFRNFITYSATEDFKEDQYIDNEFYVNRIVTAGMSTVKRDNDGNYHYPTEGAGAFYLIGLKKKDLIK